jgi:hypothetical protein
MPMRVTSQGEDIGGFAWPHMTFVWVDVCKASHHGYRLATMTLYRLLTYLKTPLLKVHLSVTTTLQRQSRYLLDYT